MKHQLSSSNLLKTTTRNYGLDIVRACAIMFVFIAHGLHLLPQAAERIVAYFLLDGVSIFFVLSGYLIGGIFIRSYAYKQICLRDILSFWKRRWLRTIPAYFFVLFVLILLSKLTGQVTDGKKFDFLFFVQNFNTPPPVFFAEAWSLSVEEWFYFLFPLLFFFVSVSIRLSFRQVILLTIFCFVTFELGYRFFYFNKFTTTTAFEWSLLYRMQVLTRLDSIAIGVFGAYVQFYRKEYWKKSKLFLCLGILIIVLTHIAQIYGWIDFSGSFAAIPFLTIEALGVLFCLPYFTKISNGSGILFQIITFVSTTSYSVYLLHRTIVLGVLLNGFKSVALFFGFNSLINTPSLVCLYVIFTFGLAFLMYRTIEIPFMRLRSYPLSIMTISKRLKLVSPPKK